MSNSIWDNSLWGPYELDGSGVDSVYYFAAYNTGGDVYYGYSIADTGTYSVGSYLYATVYDNDGGYWYYYVYAAYDLGVDTGNDGYSTALSSAYYHDVDTGTGASAFQAYAGYGGIGSEYGVISASNEVFGYYGYYEADTGGTDSLYYFAAYNTSGDLYYGYSIEETGRYEVGELYYATVYDDHGGYWSYYVYAAVDYGVETGLAGYSWVDTSYGYYDYDTGYGLGSATGYVGYDGIGSEYGVFAASNDVFGYYGMYEADYRSPDALYYYTASNTNGDVYYGYTIAATGTYSVGDIIYASGSDNDGGSWSYQIYAAYDLGYETGLDGYSIAQKEAYYYDNDTGVGASEFLSYAGYDGIGSEVGVLTASSEIFGYYGRYEADIPVSDTLYSYVANNTSGDYYYGQTIADTGTYATGDNIYASTTDNDGGTWSYVIYDASDYGYDTGNQGASWVDTAYTYYDADTGWGDASYISYVGYGGIGSELGVLTASGEIFGYSGQYEADIPVSDTLYYFTAYNTSGDYYYGQTIASTGTYAIGDDIYASATDNDGGSWYYHIYDATDYGYDTFEQGRSWVDSSYAYYDSDTGWGNATYTSHEGNGGIGSEYGFLDESGEQFGNNGQYEADNPIDDSIYWFIAYNSDGDYYNGYCFADTGTYTIGSDYYASVTDNDGGTWHYHVYDSFDYGYDLGLEGYSYVDLTYPYHDIDTGYGDATYHAFRGSAGIGSEYGYLDASGEYFGASGLYEADAI